MENTLTWIADEKLVHEQASHGGNQRAVEDALCEQHKRVKMVKDYSTEVNKVKAAAKEEADQEKVSNAYDQLVSTADKRLGCLGDIAQIASLEEALNSLTVQFSQRASSLVSAACPEPNNNVDEEARSEDLEGTARAAQSCILAVRNNWAWLARLVKCTDVHLENAANYHKFFHDVKEYEQWMPADLTRAEAKVVRPEGKTISRDDLQTLVVELKELLVTYLHWQGKLDALFSASQRVVPVPLRTRKLDYYRPVTALADYATKQVSVQEGEELTLVDSAEPETWLVRNMHAQTASVPSVLCLIPGPDPQAVAAATTLRLKFLAQWTTNVKRIGKALICVLLLLFRDPNNGLASALRALTSEERKELLGYLDFIEGSLLSYWEHYPDFKTLQKRITIVREILGEAEAGEGSDEGREVKGRVQLADDLMKKYKDFWRQWETYKVLLETSRHAEQILIVDKWQQLNFLAMEELLRKWHVGLDFDESEMVDGDSGGLEEEGSYGYGESTTVTQTEEVIEAETTTALESVSNGERVEIEHERTTAEAEQVSHREQEEKKTFVITGVMDPRSGEEVSMHQAVMLGIINSSQGCYVNPDTGESMPIPSAMSLGKIKVEFTTTKRSEEKRRDVGLITIKTQKESRPYTVKAVVDASSEKELSVDDAIAQGILNQAKGVYHNSREKTDMSLADALDSGLLIVEFDKDAPEVAPEVVTKTYAIHAVVDQSTKQKVTFTEAVKRGIIDKSTGAYHHSVDDDDIYVGDAIKRGFIKATVVKDPNSLDIDPENKMVVDKVQTIKRKLLAPMKAITALKKAANGNGK